jgi:hypothetical protein
LSVAAPVRGRRGSGLGGATGAELERTSSEPVGADASTICPAGIGVPARRDLSAMR